MKGLTDKILLEKIKSRYNKSDIQRFNLFGIRFERADKKDLFDDYIGWFDRKGNIKLYPATTEPGNHYTLNPMNRKGAARLKVGFHKSMFKLGQHRGKTPALVQVSPVIVIRDKNKNFTSDQGEYKDRGFFGINLHPVSGKFKKLRIGFNSAGCQVPACPKDFQKILQAARNSGQKYFNYMLIDGNEL